MQIRYATNETRSPCARTIMPNVKSGDGERVRAKRWDHIMDYKNDGYLAISRKSQENELWI